MPPHPSNGQLTPGVVTYRHLHNSTIGPQHPLRVIAHCDIDAAYAQFEAVRLGIDPSKPVAVQQWSGLIAVNYPARAKGITRFLNLEEAYKKCPDLICVHVATYAQGEGETEAKYHDNPTPETHKVSLDTYRRESLKILKIFSELHAAVVEKASIDESFFDLSVPVRELLLQRYPAYLSAPPEGAPLGLDTPLPKPPPVDWTGLGELVPTKFEDAAPPQDADAPAAVEGQAAQPPDIFALQKELEEEDTNWADVALALGAELMAQCRKRVFDELHYTCSAGIAKNKMLAKLCSAFKKPANQTILRNAAVLPFLRPLKFQKVRWLGGKLGIQLAEATGATTVGDLWTVPLETLQQSLGEGEGAWVWEIVRGVDHSEVEMKRETKSMLSSKNFRPSITSWGEAIHWLRVLSTDLLARLTEARQVTPGVWPKTIVLHRRNDAYTSSAKQSSFPFTSNLTLEYVFKYARRLLLDFLPGPGTAGRHISELKDATSIGRVTSLALAFHGLERVEAGQKGIEGFFGAAGAGTTRSTDIRIKSSLPTSIAGEHLKEQSNGSGEKGKRNATMMFETLEGSLNGGLAEPSTSSNQAGNTTPPRKRQKPSGPGAVAPRASFDCPRCKQTLSVPSEAVPPSSPTTSSENFVADALQKLKAEHSDKHFAQDLVEAERKANRPTSKANAKISAGGGSSTKTKSKTKGKESAKGDIASFFRTASSSKH